jgi:hypothetical protein
MIPMTIPFVPQDKHAPITAFCFSNKQRLTGEECSVNFAKCGDSLPESQFLSWIKLYSDQPNFHQPASFGKVTFAPNPVLTSV